MPIRYNVENAIPSQSRTSQFSRFFKSSTATANIPPVQSNIGYDTGPRISFPAAVRSMSQTLVFPLGLGRARPLVRYLHRLAVWITSLAKSLDGERNPIAAETIVNGTRD